MYDNTNFPRPDYLKKMESRVDTLVRHAQTSRETAPESSLNSARKAAEAICGCTLMKHKLPKSGKIPFNLEPMLNLLKENEYAMPHYIRLHAETLQKWGNAGSHFNITALPAKEIKGAMEALQSLVEWFYEDNGLTHSAAPNASDGEKPSQSDGEASARTQHRPVRVSRVKYTQPPRQPAEEPDPEEDEVFNLYEEDEEDGDENFEEFIFRKFKNASAKDDADEEDEDRIVTTNFQLELRLSREKGVIYFYSPDALDSLEPVYAAVTDSFYFDLQELFGGIGDLLGQLMGVDPGDVVFHYNHPGPWQACSLIHSYYISEEYDAPFIIPFEIYYRTAPKNRRIDGFDLCVGYHADASTEFCDTNSMTFSFRNEGIHLMPMLGGERALKYYRLNAPGFLCAAEQLIRLLNPTDYVTVEPRFVVVENDYELDDTLNQNTFSLGYAPEAHRVHTISAEHAFYDRKRALEERDAARREFQNIMEKLNKKGRQLNLSVFVIMLVYLCMVFLSESYIAQSAIYLILMGYLLYLMFHWILY